MDSMGFKKTKGGSGDKDKAYIVGKSNIKNIGICLIMISISFLILGLSLKTDISTQKRAVVHQRARVTKHKAAIFRTKALQQLDEAQQEAKLVKIFTVMQQHFSRDKREKDMTRVFKGKVKAAMDAHKKSIDTILKELEGNPTVVNYLKKTLYKAAEDFHMQASAITKQYGDAILREGQQAEQKLKKLTSSITSEMKADVKEEKREIKEETSLEKKDPEYAKLEEDFKKEGHKASQDEKDVENIIENFKENVDAIQPPTLKTDSLDDAKALLAKFEAGKSGDIKTTTNEMSKIMKSAGYKPKTTGDVAAQFREFIDEADFGPGKPEMEKDLQKWKNEKISDSEMMLDIEKQVKDGEVNPEWLHRDESKSEEATMLNLGQEDHQLHEGDSVPAAEVGDAKAAAAEEVAPENTAADADGPVDTPPPSAAP